MSDPLENVHFYRFRCSECGLEMAGSTKDPLEQALAYVCGHCGALQGPPKDEMVWN